MPRSRPPERLKGAKGSLHSEVAEQTRPRVAPRLPSFRRHLWHPRSYFVVALVEAARMMTLATSFGSTSMAT